MLVSCYLRKGVVYVPTMGLVENSYYRGVEPVSVVPIAQVGDLRHAFQAALARGNPSVPNPPPQNWPPPVILGYAGVKSWSAFERLALTWSIKEKDGVYKIIPYRRRPDRGWEQDTENVITLPPGSSTDDAIDRMISILQAPASG